MYIPKSLTYRTMTGEDKIKGTIYVQMKIFDIEQRVRLFVVDKEEFRYDILIGLDSIINFRLCQDHLCRITQASVESASENKSRVNGMPHKVNDQPTTSEISVNWNEYIPIEKFEIKTKHLDKEKRKIIYELVDKYGSVFAKNQYDVGTVKDYEASIELTEHKFVAKRPYRCSLDDQKEIESQITELLKHGQIEESCSPFAAPVTLAYKKTGEGNIKEKNRLCIDFRELNKLLVPESQPFPLIEDIIIRTRNCKWFSALDINSAFWSIPIRKRDRYKTGFVTQHGHWQWTSLPFGLRNSPAIFQRILAGIIRRNNLEHCCCNYIDDILIFSESFEEHIQHLEALMEAIKKEGFRLKFLKCNFAMNSVHYLGHEIEENSVKPLKDNVVAIRNFPVPKTRKNVRQFLGKVNFYHKYLPQASTNLEPFHRLLRKDVEFEWSDECQEAFDRIKNYLASTPAMAIFNPDLPIHVYTDASLEGMGAVLKQVQKDGEEKTVAYFSKKLNEAQKKKKAIYIESVAIREAVKYWRYWLIGKHFKVFTDHKPLEKLNLKSRPDEELGDIANYLLQYDFEVIYRPGIANGEADCLSRNPVLDSETGINDFDPIRTVNTLKLDEIKKGQEDIILKKNDITKNEIVFRKIGQNERIVLNTETGRKLIERTHLEFGHIGTKQLSESLKTKFYFRNMYKEIRDFCASCEVCIKNKSRSGSKLGFLGHLGPASEPFQIMSLDTIGGFGGRRSTKRYLHLLVDHFTRHAYILTSANQTAKEFIRIIRSVQENNKIGLLLTDQYGGLCSREFRDYLDSNGILHIYTAVDNAASNGLNERTGQTLVNRIRCRSNENESKLAWSTIAKRCTQEYNNTIHSSTGFSPNYLMNGISPSIIPVEFETKRNFEDDRKKAFENSLKAHAANKKRYDEKRIDHSFDIGDKIYVENGNKLNRNKLDEIRIGPYKIVRKVSNTVFEVNVGQNKPDHRLYHVSKMVPVRASWIGFSDC